MNSLSVRGECLLAMSSVLFLKTVLRPRNLPTNCPVNPCDSPTESQKKIPKREGLTNAHTECHGLPKVHEVT